MKGTEKIIAHIQSDAQAQCDAILAKAQETCGAIRDDYAQKAADAYGERIRAGVKSCADEGESAARLGRMEAKKALLALKQEMIAKSFALAEQKLRSLGTRSSMSLCFPSLRPPPPSPVRRRSSSMPPTASAWARLW